MSINNSLDLSATLGDMVNMDKKKIKYIKIKDDEPKKPAKKKKSKVLKNLGSALTIVGTTFSSMLLIIVIMMCIVVTVLAVYVLDFANISYDANLREAEMKYSSFIFAHDENGNEVEIKRLAADENRVWVSYENISPHMINAAVAVEDKRFYDHEGVDWQRTVYALGADVLGLDSAGQGGSTITQQLIKNITGDDEPNWERKLREIFRALSLEEKYTKVDIMESYLNRIWFGGMVYGVGAASQYYFGKDAADLNPGEAAILAGMIRNPGKLSPYVSLSDSKRRQKYALQSMYEQGYINTKEYEDYYYNREFIRFARPVYGTDYGYIDGRTLVDEDEADEIEDDFYAAEEYEAYKWNGDYTVSQNWYVDAAIVQVVNDFAEEKGISYTSAKNEIYNGGYKIYLNMDIEIQNKIEEKYRDPYTVLSSYDPKAEEKNLIQSAFVLMDYNGTVVGLAGGLGEKPGDNCFNRATQAKRAPGSSIKPIAIYSNAVENNIITYSTMVPNIGIKIPIDPNEPEETKLWPTNYTTLNAETGDPGDGKLTPAWYAVRKSMNTISAQICQKLTPQKCFDQLTQRLGFTTLIPSDIAYSPMALGGLSEGAHLIELAAAYQIFGNGGVYYDPMLYSRVEDSKGNIILEQDFFGTQAISPESAWVTNRMMRTVVTDTSGTGRLAQLDNVEVIGKTGTSNAQTDLLFVGCTPDYVGAMWLGYDDNHKIGSADGWKAVASIWKTVMVDIQDQSTTKYFTADSSVLERSYCTETGLLATSRCTKTETGYYKRDNMPDYCTGNHKEEQAKIYLDWLGTEKLSEYMYGEPEAETAEAD